MGRAAHGCPLTLHHLPHVSAPVSNTGADRAELRAGTGKPPRVGLLRSRLPAELTSGGADSQRARCSPSGCSRQRSRGKSTSRGQREAPLPPLGGAGTGTGTRTGAGGAGPPPRPRPPAAPVVAPPSGAHTHTQAQNHPIVKSHLNTF